MDKTKPAKSEAVSPVIGAIPIVAITVILAAVAAAFVFGAANDIHEANAQPISKINFTILSKDDNSHEILTSDMQTICLRSQQSPVLYFYKWEMLNISSRYTCDNLGYALASYVVIDNCTKV
jgi:hypothetical protein